MWIPPAREHQNGIIIRYVINITVEETGENYQLYTNTTNITATLTPFTMYTIVITAENSVGTGPYTDVVSIRSEEAGNSNTFFIVNSGMHKSLGTMTVYSILCVLCSSHFQLPAVLHKISQSLLSAHTPLPFTGPHHLHTVRTVSSDRTVCMVVRNCLWSNG